MKKYLLFIFIFFLPFSVFVDKAHACAADETCDTTLQSTQRAIGCADRGEGWGCTNNGMITVWYQCGGSDCSTSEPIEGTGGSGCEWRDNKCQYTIGSIFYCCLGPDGQPPGGGGGPGGDVNCRDLSISGGSFSQNPDVNTIKSYNLEKDHPYNFTANFSYQSAPSVSGNIKVGAATTCTGISTLGTTTGSSLTGTHTFTAEGDYKVWCQSTSQDFWSCSASHFDAIRCDDGANNFCPGPDASLLVHVIASTPPIPSPEVPNPTPTTPNPPTNLQGQCTCVGSNCNAIVSWNSAIGADFYALRVDDLSNSWQPGSGCNTSFTNTGLNGDQCLNIYSNPYLNSNNYTFLGTANHTYNWWMHARTNGGAWIPASGLGGPGFTCQMATPTPIPATPTPSPSPSPTPSVLGVAWWQSKDGDIISANSIRSALPMGTFLSLEGANSNGVFIYGGTLTKGAGDIGESTNWSVKTDYSGKVYNYAYFNDQITNKVPDANINTPTTNVFNENNLEAGTPAYNGYQYFKYTGDGGGEFNIAILELADRKVVLLVENVTVVNITSLINLTKGRGFFALITNSPIEIAPSVGGSSPDVEGIYLTDGMFSTGAGTSTLKVRGTVIAGGFSLDRILPDNSLLPAEFFEFAPDQILLMPPPMTVKRTTWQEVAP